MSWNVHIDPFGFLPVQDCAVFKEHGVIVTAKFAMRAEGDGMDVVKESMQGSMVEVSILQEYRAAELEALWAALRAFDVRMAAPALRLNGITDSLSLPQMQKMECFLPVLLRVSDAARAEIFDQVPFYHRMRSISAHDPLGSLVKLERQGFFHSWDRGLLARVMRRQMLLCQGELRRLTLRRRQSGRVLAGVLHTTGGLRVHDLAIPALEQASDGWVNVLRICRVAAARTADS